MLSIFFDNRENATSDNAMSSTEIMVDLYSILSASLVGTDNDGSSTLEG